MKKKISKLLGTAEPHPGYPWFSFTRWSSYLHWYPNILGVNNTKIPSVLVPVLNSRHKNSECPNADPSLCVRTGIFSAFFSNFLVNLGLDPNSYSSESSNLHSQSWFWFVQAWKILLYWYGMSMKMKKKISNYLEQLSHILYPWFSFPRWSPNILGVNMAARRSNYSARSHPNMFMYR